MPDTLLFDKLTYIDRLTKAGIDEAQARAHAEAMEEALREGVATKRDITELRHAMELLGRDLKIWTGGIAVVLFSALVAARFFIH
jgi:hypothetical protein